jgi:hypothetical protein
MSVVHVLDVIQNHHNDGCGVLPNFAILQLIGFAENPLTHS